MGSLVFGKGGALRCLLDTNVVIGLFKQKAESLDLLKASGLRFEQMAVSQITRMELLGYRGISSEEVQTVEAFLRKVEVLTIDDAIEAHTIDIRQKHTMKLPDSIVWATAKAHHLELLTFDKKLIKLAQNL